MKRDMEKKNLRFLLTAINAKYIHSNLAVYSLRAAAKACGVDVELAEFTINHYIEFILQELYKRKPDVLFFSCYIWNWEYVKELAAECRKIMPGTPVWVGGPEVSYDAAQVLRENPAITGVLLGEGEDSFPKLLQFYEGMPQAGYYCENQVYNLCWDDRLCAGLEAIEGLAYRKLSGLSDESDPSLKILEKQAGMEQPWEVCVQPLITLPDLNKIPFPYEDMEGFEHKIIYYESSRGCPFSCSYCLSSIDKRVRFRSLELVKKELGFFLERKVPQVKFVDRTFNCKESHALEIWSYLLEHDNCVTNFHFEIAADLLTEKELALVERMRPGLIQLEIGVQSTHLQTLQEIRRVMDFELVKEKVRRVQGFRNTHQHLDLIAGLPYENLDRFVQSFDEVFALRPEQLQLGFLKVLKGSWMHEKADDYGMCYREKAPYEVLGTNWISYGDLLRLKGIEQMVEVYYNSHQFSLTLQELLKEWPSAFAFFEALADYYEMRGFHQVQHARARRYEILLEFIRDRLPEQKATCLEKYRELLTFDYYLREYAKSRPAFAADITDYKEEIRSIQKRCGRNKHVEVSCFAQIAGTGQVSSGELYGDVSGRASGNEHAAPRFWIFDYENRSPLTNDAAICLAEVPKDERSRYS